MIRVVNDVRKEHGRLNKPWPSRALEIDSEGILADGNTNLSFPSAMFPADRLDTFNWLLHSVGSDESNLPLITFARGALLEAAGQHTEALSDYRRLESRLGSSATYSLAKGISAGIFRLTHKH